MNEAENETQRMKKTNMPVYFVYAQSSYNIYIVWEGCRLERNKRIYYYYYYFAKYPIGPLIRDLKQFRI